MVYSRNNPSEAYLLLEEQYKAIRDEAHKGDGKDKPFTGGSLKPHLSEIQNLLRETGSSSLMDYGCGAAEMYAGPLHVAPLKGRTLQEFWGIDTVRLYDPGEGQYGDFPVEEYDAVISTDVLEHVPEEDVDWVLDEIFLKASRLVFLSIACYPANKVLPNGMNAHVLIRPPSWWNKKISDHKRDGIRTRCVCMMKRNKKSIGKIFFGTFKKVSFNI